MPRSTLDALLGSLSVEIEAFAIVRIAEDQRLVFPPMAGIEVHHVLEGTLHLRIDEGMPIEVPQGWMLVVPPGKVQRMAASAGATREYPSSEVCVPVRDGMVILDATDGAPAVVRVACGIVLPDPHGSYGPLDGLARYVAEDVSNVRLVSTAFDSMLMEATDPGEGTMALTSALMKACLIVLLRRHMQTSRDAGIPPALLRHARVGRAVAAILERPAADHSVASLAIEAGMSRSAFARDFRDALDSTPMEFVARARLAHAHRLLMSTGHSVATIASIVGFASRSHLSRSFRALYGTDPTTFRRAAGAREIA